MVGESCGESTSPNPAPSGQGKRKAKVSPHMGFSPDDSCESVRAEAHVRSIDANSPSLKAGVRGDDGLV